MEIVIIITAVILLTMLLQLPFKIYFIDVLNENKINASFFDFGWDYDIFRDFILTCDKDFETKKKYLINYTRAICIKWVGVILLLLLFTTGLLIILMP